jgi:hypothetical protein
VQNRSDRSTKTCGAPTIRTSCRFLSGRISIKPDRHQLGPWPTRPLRCGSDAIRLSYIGSETHQLVWAPDENTLPFSSTQSAANAPITSRLFPNWGRINTRATGANESYHLLQTEFSHRFQKGLQVNSSYTFAKALADNEGPGTVITGLGFAGETGGQRASSILDRRADFGNVYGTRRNRWNSTMVYDLPVGRGKQFGSSMNRFADLAIGGWRTSFCGNRVRSKPPISLVARAILRGRAVG